ncbi:MULTISPECIES: 2-amino-4-hydroxy-6-hydroxymethyldihydropteridine diphosphokinase [unclassified Granulicatella]|uniref:2-amino-4-hydroxy-6- hydroxymethyldihydropteridine diphosphokinase n=1 Tax=unclassified Granulicatella TaxID=2630493 RepID=UPI001072FE45|nr:MULTISPECIES: 2-amino-4-hydroxy-6-hydroxymethyldihydropteridine diphosphokinase [unclassified Granulicatella]MBF0781064.1 2-amino-4-hydroxy-6-hydroxymethyldihydropteridine diphosphokinase [Granulicatella sp. 19428wC4_WM01]TFU92264.1 2-amino-4-hydroxy-6-hydroxymethyldihydropteridine diphosphokinase [Granulicatella sp. WM01]
MDKLEIKGLSLFAHHGVFASEKELGQKFIIHATIYYDMSQAAVNGDLEKSIHYGELSEQLVKWCQSEKEDLIETVAFKLIERIFETYSIVQQVDLELQKPWAPVHLPLDVCSVTLSRKKRRMFIGLGTNMGDKVALLDKALQSIEHKGLRIVKVSKRLETEPWGLLEQDTFLNQVIEIETYFEPLHVLHILQQIEQEMGRVRQMKWGPRCIDLDILMIGDEILQHDHLVVPHPYMCEREFVLAPLAEIAPFAIHPLERTQIRLLLERLRQQDTN